MAEKVTVYYPQRRKVSSCFEPTCPVCHPPVVDAKLETEATRKTDTFQLRT
jgi:hypothetical protein